MEKGLADHEEDEILFEILERGRQSLDLASAIYDAGGGQ